MDRNHSSCWDSILERVKLQIPTIDLDSAAVDNEEAVTIYERPAGLSLKLPEDFDSFSVDDELEELLKPVGETCVEIDDNEMGENTLSAAQCSTHKPDADVEADASDLGHAETNRAKPDTSVKTNVDNTNSKEGFLVLSFRRLDEWDLDGALRNLKEGGLSLQQNSVSVRPSKTHADGDKDRLRGNIMERLVALSKSQSAKSMSEPVKSLNHTRWNNVYNKSPERMAAELQWRQKECPTVYIDLRCPDPLIKQPRTSPNLSSEPRSPAKHNIQQETPPAKKHNLEPHTGSQRADREVTGKSLLLREMKRNRKKNPNKCTNPPYSALRIETEERKGKLPGSVQSHPQWEDKQDSCGQFECRNPKRKIPPSPQQSAIKDPKQQSEQQRQQVKPTSQHEHQQVLKQLEMHRPTKSVNQNQPAAERTHVLYDLEASRLQSISTLPAGVESKGCMLLIIDLSTPGMVGGRAHGRGKHLYPAATKSHIYNTLVAWFLSLVGPDPHQDEDEASAKVPFWVAGLQQLWTEDGLALHVLAVARHCYTPKKKDTDIHVPFYNHVCRFLSETSLSHVARWLPQLQNLLYQKPFASPVHLPSSCLNCFISATFNKKVIDRTFGLRPGFYWQTVETREHVCKGRETALDVHTEVSVALGCKAFFLDPLTTHYTLQRVLDSGLDVCGLRLLYPPQAFLSDSDGAAPVIQRTDESCQPVLVLAVRGPHAHSVLKDLMGSLDPLLPRKTDPNALKPLHCRTQDPPLFYSPRLATQVHRELCLWFSGRVQVGSGLNYNRPLNRSVPLEDGGRGSLSNSSRSPSFLCATTKADLLLVVSPAVPPCCYIQVLAVCERRGFGLRGVQRLQLQSGGAAVLGLTNQQVLVFCSPHSATLDQEELERPSHCLVLLLRKENAMRHSVNLPAALMRELKEQNLLGCIDPGRDGVHTLDPSLCFHTVSYSSNLFNMFVRRMWAVPDSSAVILSRHKCSSDSEQAVIVTLCGKDMSQGLSLLHRVLTEGPEGDTQRAGFRLLGLKCLPALTRLQAQELSPYEVGEQLCHSSLDSLMSSPALLCCLRLADGFASLRKHLMHDSHGNLSVLMSSTPEVALRQATLFFSEQEMISDNRILKHRGQNSNTTGARMLLTVCLCPRVWHRSLAELVSKLQLSGLTLVGLRLVTLDRSSAASLTPAECDASDAEAQEEHLCSGSSLALCLEGQDAVRRLLDVLGREDSTLCTTRGGMALSRKGIYGSGSYRTAIQDVKRLFPEGLCCAETSTMRQEQILSLCSDPLASVERQQSCTVAPVAQESLSPLMAPGPNGGSLIHSAVWQTTCLLIPLNASPPSQAPHQLDMLEQLLRSGCHLVAGRMSKLDNEQRKHVAETLKVSSRGNEQLVHLSTAPCLIMALQGEAIVTSFTLILESIYEERSDLEKTGKMIIYPESLSEAEQLICYLFDTLSLEAYHSIVP